MTNVRIGGEVVRPGVGAIAPTLAIMHLLFASPAIAQRADENVVTSADDAFGKSVGDEIIGLYGGSDVRDFSAFDAGNVRIEGLYYDQQGALIDAVERSSTIQVGLSALGYPFPAPTGIVDYELRRVGDKPVVSVRAGVGDYFGPQASVDAAIPLTDSLDVNIGAGADRAEYVSGAYTNFVRYGGVLRHRPTSGVELTGFFGRYDYNEIQSPVYFTAGSYLPKRIERRRYFGQLWPRRDGHAQNFGGLAKGALGNWRIEGGLFNSRFTFDRFASDLVRNIMPNGRGDRTIIGGIDQRDASTSGELRVSRDVREGNRLHRVIGSVRARQVDARYGGFDAVDIGASTIGTVDVEPEADYAFGDLTRDRVRQETTALGYELRWAGIGELNLGLAKTRYRKTVAEPSRPETEQTDSPWLWNASAALTAIEDLVIYAAATRGLEESGIAPSNAANSLQALPALRTRQFEAGLRYALPADMRLVAAVFDIRKPYFAIDTDDNVFRTLGDVRHRGVEVSLSGQPLTGLNVVGGAVFLSPRVTGEAVDDGRLGHKPLGRTGAVVDLRLDYRFPRFDRLSVDLGILYNARRVARVDNSLYIPERATLDIGARYRFQLRNAPATLRVQMRNVTNVFGWRVFNGGGFAPNDARRLIASLTADF